LANNETREEEGDFFIGVLMAGAVRGFMIF
jgi:hypothetical protein